MKTSKKTKNPGMNVFVFIRVILGFLYIVSGTEKLLEPYENFVYVIQGYDIVRNGFLEHAAAWLFPWMEFIVGGFLLIGLWLRSALITIGSFSAIFIVVVGQAILRGLELDKCGCFGDFVHIPLWAVFVLDVVVLTLAIILIRSIDKTSAFSLDSHYLKRK